MPKPFALDRTYEYRRRLPHYQKPGQAIFVTLCKLGREPFPPAARNSAIRHCVYDHGRRFKLHAAVVMPEHVHLLLTPLEDPQGWPYALPAILKLIKGVSARDVNRLLGWSGPVWQEESFDHVLRSVESLAEKLEYIRQNPVRRGLVQKPEDYPWPPLTWTLGYSITKSNFKSGGQECPPHKTRATAQPVPMLSSAAAGSHWWR